MKKFISLLLPLILLARAEAQGVVTSGWPAGAPKFTPIESPERKDQKENLARAFNLFTNKNYDALEKMAADYRASKVETAGGFQKLACVYNGLMPSKRDPDAVWEERRVQLQDWIRAKPQSPTPRIAMARLLTDYAWKIRGGGWASEVKPEAWQSFSSRLRDGLRYLDEAKKLPGKCPAYWSSLQRIALGLQFDKKRYDKIFEQATNEFPNYTPCYEVRANYLLPRWNGEEGEWEADLARSADALGGEAGDMLYTRVVWFIHQTLDSTNVFADNKGLSYPRVLQGFTVILKRFPDSMAAKTELIQLAVQHGDRQTAEKYFSQLNGQNDIYLWYDIESYDYAVRWVYSKAARKP